MFHAKTLRRTIFHTELTKFSVEESRGDEEGSRKDAKKKNISHGVHKVLGGRK
jgi:hypothetical protein